MTKKDYQAIARALWEASVDIGHHDPSLPKRQAISLALQRVRGGLIDILAADNPRFDRERFIEACETGQTKGMRSVANQGRGK